MVDKIEMSLDDIIKANKSTRRGGKGRGGGRGATRGGNIRRAGGGGGGFRKALSQPQRGAAGGGVQRGRNRGGIARSKYTRGDVNSAWKHDMFDGAKKQRLTTLGPAKLMVSNLDYGVSESDINELFADFGPLKSASVHYDRSGRSLGTADVVFERRADAIKAMKQYNGVPLDGRPMSIQLATSEIPANRTPVRLGGGGGGSGVAAPSGFAGTKTKRFPGGNKPAGQRRGGGGGGRGGNRNSRAPAPTAEELDAELDAYTKDMKI